MSTVPRSACTLPLMLTWLLPVGAVAWITTLPPGRRRSVEEGEQLAAVGDFDCDAGCLAALQCDGATRGAAPIEAVMRNLNAVVDRDLPSVRGQRHRAAPCRRSRLFHSCRWTLQCRC